ncbi:hypothetical protein BDZ97DRAFT_144962 [Flammula alnicola]|nr:hypothetical protein BDZ97DRAFT_144962 [Flammula alnicola]
MDATTKLDDSEPPPNPRSNMEDPSSGHPAREESANPAILRLNSPRSAFQTNRDGRSGLLNILADADTSVASGSAGKSGLVSSPSKKRKARGALPEGDPNDMAGPSFWDVHGLDDNATLVDAVNNAVHFMNEGDGGDEKLHQLMQQDDLGLRVRPKKRLKVEVDYASMLRMFTGTRGIMSLL